MLLWYEIASAKCSVAIESASSISASVRATFWVDSSGSLCSRLGFLPHLSFGQRCPPSDLGHRGAARNIGNSYQQYYCADAQHGFNFAPLVPRWGILTSRVVMHEVSQPHFCCTRTRFLPAGPGSLVNATPDRNCPGTVGHVVRGVHDILVSSGLPTGRSLELENLPSCASALITGAVNRKESRDAPACEDFSERDDANWMKHSLSWKQDAGTSPELSYRPVHNDTRTDEIEYMEPKKRVY